MHMLEISFGLKWYILKHIEPRSKARYIKKYILIFDRSIHAHFAHNNSKSFLRRDLSQFGFKIYLCFFDKKIWIGADEV